MWHDKTTEGTSFVDVLVEIDEQLAEDVKRRGCECGGRLHRADYPRKVRGVPPEYEWAFERRISFCCEKDGCRRRHTPPSVRFLGRRVYGAAVVLACAAQSAWAATIDVPRRTVRRWQAWFGTQFVRSKLWQAVKARFMPPVAQDGLPGTLLGRLSGSPIARLVAALRLLCPLTTSGESSSFARDG